MTSMVERVARAMHADTNNSNEHWIGCEEITKETYRSNARAALKELRVPTKEMEGAAGDYMDEHGCNVLSSLIVNEIWRAMIDKAREE